MIQAPALSADPQFTMAVLQERRYRIVAQRLRIAWIGAEMLESIVPAVVTIQSTRTQRNPECAISTFEHTGNRTETDTVRARRIVLMVAELSATGAQLVQAGIE